MPYAPPSSVGVRRQRALQQAEPTAHRRAWPDDTRNAQRNRLDAPEVQPRSVQIEQRLFQRNQVASGAAQREQRERRDLRQVNVSHEHRLASVVVEVRELQALDVSNEPVGRKQSLCAAGIATVDAPDLRLAELVFAAPALAFFATSVAN